MPPSLRLLAFASAFSLAALSARAAAAESGYIDLGQFKSAPGCEFVEVNLHSTLLKFASIFVNREDSETAALIRSLKHVRVNVIGYDETNRAETAGRVQKIRGELEAQGWTQIISVRKGGDTEDVVVYVKTRGEDAIDGLVVTVIDPAKHQAVLVNIVGNIRPEQLAGLGRGLHIDHLSAHVPAGKGA
jgi:hypothetical protein